MQDRMPRFARNDGRIELIALPWKNWSRSAAIPDKNIEEQKSPHL
jgi:hypothetical protein